MTEDLLSRVAAALSTPASKRLFVVRVTTEVAVVAIDATSAASVARRAVRREDEDAFDVLVWDEPRVPVGWSRDCLPYGDDLGKRRQWDVGQWLDASAPAASAKSESSP